jgi:hypothetical protein
LKYEERVGLLFIQWPSMSGSSWKVPRLLLFVILVKSNVKMSTDHWGNDTDRGSIIK